MNNKNGTTTKRIASPVRGFLLACLTSSALAAEGEPTPPAGTPVDAEVFTGPKMLRTPIPSYPGTEERDGNEGWVRVNMMIDPKGKPYEINVVDSTGNRTFERVTLETIQKWTFEPAKRAGEAIDGSFNVKVLFFLSQQATGARPHFVSAYKKLLKAIEANDRTAADSQLPELTVHNLYEDAYLNLARFHYHYKWGTEEEQLHDLRGAVAGESTPRYLDKKTFVAALGRRLVLEVKSQDFGQALKTWETLRPIAPKDSLQMYQEVIDKIETLRKNDSAVRISARLGELSSWNGELFKKRFQITVTSGQISDIKLRCQKQYLFFHYQPGVEYTVEPKRGGECSIELVGDPGTKFDLIQS